MKKNFPYIMVTVICFLFFSSLNSRAEIVYDNGESEWSQGTGWSCSSQIGFVIAADDFILDSDRKITGVSIDVSDRTEHQWDGTVEYWILNDNSGSPGTVKASGNGKCIAVDMLDILTFSRHFVVEFDLDQGVSLLGGTRYWLALHFQADYDSPGAGWECSVLDVSNDLHYSGGELIGGVPAFPEEGNPYPGYDLAFRLKSEKKVNVPVRICAVEGSSAANADDTDTILLQRLNKATEIWGMCAGIRFHSAMTAGTNSSFPVADDPNPDLGSLGAIEHPDYSDQEMKDAIADCDAKWGALNISQGLIMLNVENFVDENGSILGDRWGRGGNNYSYSFQGSEEDPACTEDLSRLTNNDGWAVVIDNSYTEINDPNDKLLAHELGHALYLGHGDGLDNDNDGVYDYFCDDNEDPYALPTTIMHPEIPTATKVITSPQKNTARGFAKVTPGNTTSASKAQPGYTTGDHRTDPAHDVSDDSVDIVSVGMVENAAAGTSVFFHSLFGTIPFAGNNQYLIFADLDDDSSTGGSPSILGFATGFTGAEIITQVTVTPDSLGTIQLVSPTLWRFQAGTFKKIVDPQIQASVRTTIEAESGVPLSDVVYIQLPSTVLGTPVTKARIQGLAEQMTTGELDRLPDEPLAGGLTISLIPPEYPDCVATPLQAKPGEYVTVETTGLVPGEVATVFLGDQQVAETSIDNDGIAVASFLVPYPTVTGLRLVSVAVGGTALSAGDLVEIQESANIPPVADAGPDMTVERTSTAGAQLQMDGSGSYDPNGDPLTYTFTWTDGSASGVNPTITLPPGETVVTLTVTDGQLYGIDEVVVTVADTTPPEVTIITPQTLVALQDGVTFKAHAADISGIDSVFFYVREPGGISGIPIGKEDLPATLNTDWQYQFDTRVLEDGHYIILAKAIDTYGNEGWSEIVHFSIRNWAVIELLPASESNKAGRTMPVKFSLRTVSTVDPSMPFVYNEDLEIKIYKASDPGSIIQTSLYGDSSKDYRIDTDGEIYITNFKTDKKPAEYVVEIWRSSNDFLVGSFTFETVK